jgi:hypothetical protein
MVQPGLTGVSNKAVSMKAPILMLPTESKCKTKPRNP